MRPGDRIEIRGLRASGCHGAAPGERDHPQPFEVDADLVVDTEAAGASDALADTVDYGEAVEAIARVVSSESHRLLETLARRSAQVVLDLDDRVMAASVTVRKLRPPVPVDLATAGVRVSLRHRRGSPRRVFLGLGANLGDRWAVLRDAVAATPDVVGVSGVYETEPVGGPAGQPPYLNLVVELWTARSARELLGVARRLEAAAGRRREVHHGPRTLDVDVLLIGGESHDHADLVVPHPRMLQRRFVLAPLAELAPGMVGPEDLAAAGGRVQRLGPLGEGPAGEGSTPGGG